MLRSADSDGQYGGAGLVDAIDDCLTFRFVFLEAEAGRVGVDDDVAADFGVDFLLGGVGDAFAGAEQKDANVGVVAMVLVEGGEKV